MSRRGMTRGGTAAHERRFAGDPERLRSAERREQLEVRRVVELSGGKGPPGLVLDIGTGTGVFAEGFLRAGNAVIGLDVNPRLLAEARAHVPGARFVVGLAERLPFRDRSCDVAFLGTVLHELDDVEEALREARRVTRRWVVALEFRYVEEDIGPPLSHRLRPEAILAAARLAGFDMVERITLRRMDFYLMRSAAHGPCEQVRERS